MQNYQKIQTISFFGYKSDLYTLYTFNDLPHRIDGPACIYYFEDGSVEMEAYFIHGRRHREDGPAMIWYNFNGNIEHTRYYLHGLPLEHF